MKLDKENLDKLFEVLEKCEQEFIIVGIPMVILSTVELSDEESYRFKFLTEKIKENVNRLIKEADKSLAKLTDARKK